MKKLLGRTKHFLSEHKFGKAISIIALGILAYVIGGIILLGATIGGVKAFRRSMKNKASVSHRLLVTLGAAIVGGILAFFVGRLGEFVADPIGFKAVGNIVGGMIGAGIAAIVGKRMAGKVVSPSKKLLSFLNTNKRKAKKAKKVSHSRKLKGKFRLKSV